MENGNGQLVKAGQGLDLENPDMVSALKRTVAQGATDEEFIMFSELCKATGLSPFKREIWFIKAGGRAQIMTGINGYLAVANRHPQFDGLEVEIEADGQGNPIKAIAKAWRKDRRIPSVGVALLKEFRKDTPVWKQMPGHMLAKVAKCIALREAFSQELNGTYAEEEMDAQYGLKASEPGQTIEVVAEPKRALPIKTADEIPAKTLHYYDLAAMAPENIADAERFLKHHGAHKDEAIGLWVSPKPLKSLAKYTSSIGGDS